MGLWQSLDSIADYIRLPRGNSDGQSGGGPYTKRDPRGTSADAGRHRSSADPMEAEDDEEVTNYQYKRGMGNGYVTAGAQPQNNRKEKRGGGRFAELVERIRNAGQPQQRNMPQDDEYDDNEPYEGVQRIDEDEEEPYDDNDNIVDINDYEDDRPLYEPPPKEKRREKEKQPRAAEPPPRETRRERDARARNVREERYDDEETEYQAVAGGSRRMRTMAQTVIYLVRRMDDAGEIIGFMMDGGNVIINMEEVDDQLKQRMLDMISGAAYALQCDVQRISYRNYFVAPNGEEIYSNVAQRERSQAESGGYNGLRSMQRDRERRY